jgi:DNA-binding MarR family transcriptional regulator
MSNSQPQQASSSASSHPWTEEESEAAFAILGDQIIDATRRYLRSARRQQTQARIYTVDGIELTLAQVDTLEAVVDNDLRMNELAARLGIDPSTATRSIAPLVDLGLVERFVDPQNRRFVGLQCTPRGREVSRRITARRRALMREVLAPMAPARRLQFAELFNEFLYLNDVAVGRSLDEPVD